MKVISKNIAVIACVILTSTAQLHAADQQKRVVLTFDDACKSHATVVAPLLKKHGFNATFFISEGFSFTSRKDIYMTWEEIKKLHDQGFEIGNHTKAHHDMRKLSEEVVDSEIAHIEAQCKKHGIPKTTTFAYPGYHTSKTVVKVLKERGYNFARTGGGKASRPGKDDPLLLPDALSPTPKTTFDELKKAAGQADDEHIPIFTFHGVPDAEHGWVSTSPEMFEEFMQYLKDNDFKAIALRDYPVKKLSTQARPPNGNATTRTTAPRLSSKKKKEEILPANAKILQAAGHDVNLALPKDVKAGFFTPRRAGKIWDTWMYHHEGKYYMYYLAGIFGKWDGHELATSEDGVHWTEHGVILKPRPGVTWMGTGHIWKSPDFERDHRWIMNYSEWFGDKQNIMFATSTDLVNWTKVDEKHRFVQDTRWYKPKGRWDCIDTIRRKDGGFYGYFTADPDRAKLTYEPCQFGFARSGDGITWEALPPVEGNMKGEFGGIEKLEHKYYILISEGRVGVGDKPEGPFLSQSKNYNLFGRGCDIYFPRFFHNAPGGPLVNHFYKNGTVFAAPIKAIDIDNDGTMRLKWWKNNDKLKAKPVETRLVAAGSGYASSIRMLDRNLDLSRTHVIEGEIDLSKQRPGDDRPGILFDGGDGQAQCLLLERDKVQFGSIKADGSNLKIQQTSNRNMDFGASLKFRLVIKLDMMELYVNDYLMNLKRIKCNGKIGVMDTENKDAFKHIQVWQSK